MHALSFSATCFLLAFSLAPAATYTWKASGSNDNWPDNDNWRGSSGSPNSATDIAQLHGSEFSDSARGTIDLTSANKPSDGQIEVGALRVTANDANDQWHLRPGHRARWRC